MPATTFTFNSLNVTFEDRLALLVFDHGKANEIGTTELAELEALCDALQANETLALISTSRKRSRRGTAIFVAGANVTERQGWSNEDTLEHVRYQRSVLQRLRWLPLFHVVVANGVALGWGTEFMITADYRIATPDARFGLPETSLGIVPGAGGTAELSALIGLPQTIRLGMSAERIDADEARRIGLVQELADTVDAGLERARALANKVLRCSPTAVAAFKQAALASIGQPVENRDALEDAAYTHCVETGEAARGRAQFNAIRNGEPVSWGPRQPLAIFEEGDA